MPGLLRGVARTAVIAGTATAVSNRVPAGRQTAGRSRSPSNITTHLHLRQRRPLSRPATTRSAS